MRHVTARALRSVFAVLAAASGAFGACAALLVGCGHDGEDDASASDSGLVDTHSVDVAVDPPDGGARLAPRLTFVNATHDLGPGTVERTSSAVRFCFLQGATAETLGVVPVVPLPDRVQPGAGSSLPGIPAASGVSLPLPDLNFVGRIIVPIVFSARSLLRFGGNGIRPAATCDELVGDARDASLDLIENVDYWTLPALQPGALQAEHAYVVVLSGCAGNAATPNPGKCGIGFVEGDGQPGIGNLRLTAYETTGSPVAAPLGAQLLHASTQANAYFSQLGAKDTIHPGFFRFGSGTDGGGALTPITDASPTIGTLSAITRVDDVALTDSFAFGPKPLFPSTLAEIEDRSGLATPYANGRNYVFIAVGDPDPGETFVFIKPDGSRGQTGGGDGSRFNNRSFHFLAYPADGR